MPEDNKTKTIRLSAKEIKKKAEIREKRKRAEPKTKLKAQKPQIADNDTPEKSSDSSLIKDYWIAKYYPDQDEMLIPNKTSNLFNKIRNSKHHHIDGKMLFTMINLVFWLALKKSEVMDLKIEDVIDNQGQIYSQIQIGNSTIPAPENIKRLINDHINYLRNTPGYQSQSNSFLFQDKKGGKYTEARRHLKNKFSQSKPFEEIRQAGIMCYYNSLSSMRTKTERYKKTAEFARNKTVKSIKGIITDNKLQAGKRTSIDRKLNLVWQYIKKIDDWNDLYISKLDEIIEINNELLEDIKKERNIAPDIKQMLISKIKDVIEKNKLSIKSNSNLAQLSSSYDKMGFSKTLSMVEINEKRKKFEISEKLLWLIDQIVMVPISDIEEVDQFKNLFLNTLSTLSFEKDPEDNQRLKEELLENFADEFFKKNVVFNARSGATYIFDKMKNNIAPDVYISEIIKHEEKRIIEGKLDEDLVELLTQCNNNDLEPLLSYIVNSNEGSSVLSILLYYLDNYEDHIEDISKNIQQYEGCYKQYLGINRLAPYKEVVCFVADKLEVNYDNNQKIDVIEFQILAKILEYSWEDMDDSIREKLLSGVLNEKIIDPDPSLFPRKEMLSIIEQGGERAYKISLIVANALAKSELNNGLTINREPNFERWVQLFENPIVKGFEKISIASAKKGTIFFETLTYVVHIAMLRQQLQKRRSILFRKFNLS